MKKLSKATIVLIILIVYNLHSFGQQFGIKASGGISRIYGAFGNLYTVTYPNTPASSSFSPSLQGGIYYLLPMGKRTSLGAELLYSKVQGWQTFHWDDNFMNASLNYTFYEEASYLSFPIYVGLTFNRLTFTAGIQAAQALSGSGGRKVILAHDGIEDEVKSLPLFNFQVRNFDFGPRAGIFYQLNNRLSVEGMFYYGLGNISYPKSPNTELKIQQMTVGLRYAFRDKQEVNLNSFANQQWGIKASGGFSKITNTFQSYNETCTTPFIPSGQMGLFYSCPLSKKSSMGAEFLFSQIEGKEILEEDITFVDGNKGVESTILYRHISYLSIPVYYGYTFKWLTINGGFQFSYALASGWRVKKNWISGAGYKNETDDISGFDFGPRAGIIYQLNDKLALEGTSYYGFNNIFKGGSPSRKLNVQQMTVGIRYALWNKSKNQ